MNRVGTTGVYQSCINFTLADGNSFKIDPNGGWGPDATPAQDYAVASGWVKILFNSATKTITGTPNQTSNCGVEIYYLRGTQSATAWDEGDLFTPVDGSLTDYEICRNFSVGDGGSDPTFKIDPDGGWGDDAFPAENTVASGWTKIVIDITTNAIVSQQSDLDLYCANAL